MVDLVAQRPRKELLAALVAAVRRGVTIQQLLGAAFLVPILTGGDESDVHASLAIPSISAHVAFHQAISDEERLLTALWGVCNAQLWSRRQRPANRAQVSVPDPATALASALREADQRRAEAAVSSLIAVSGAEQVASVLRLYASQHRGDPHTAIYAAQSTRALLWLPPRYADPILRSVARYLARAGRPPVAPSPIPCNEADTTAPREIAHALVAARGTSLAGLSSRAIWEALALLSIETRLAEQGSPTGAAVHQTTLLDALWFIHDQATPAQRAQIVATAVPWILDLHGSVTRAPAADHAVRFAAAWSAVRNNEPEVVETLRRAVARKGSNEHDFKYFGAVETVAPKLSLETRQQWWAAATLAHPSGATEGWELGEQARTLLR